MGVSEQRICSRISSSKPCPRDSCTMDTRSWLDVDMVTECWRWLTMIDAGEELKERMED